MEVQRNYVCLVHDPANNLKCRSRDCQKQHLDTTRPELTERFAKATAAADAAKERQESGSGRAKRQ